MGRRISFVVHAAFVPYYLGYDEMGKKKYVTKRGFPSEKAAPKYLTEILHTINQGTYVDPSKLPFSEFLDQWLDNKADQVRPKTLDMYRRTINLHVIPHVGRVKLTDLKPVHLRDLYNPSTQKRAISAIRGADSQHDA
jgi:integrase